MELSKHCHLSMWVGQINIILSFRAAQVTLGDFTRLPKNRIAVLCKPTWSPLSESRSSWRPSSASRMRCLRNFEEWLMIVRTCYRWPSDTDRHPWTPFFLQKHLSPYSSQYLWTALVMPASLRTSCNSSPPNWVKHSRLMSLFVIWNIPSSSPFNCFLN